VSRRAPALAVLRGDRSLFTEIAALASHVLPKRAFWEATRLSTYSNSLISMVGAYGLEPWRPWTGFRTGFQSFAWRCLERLQKHLPAGFCAVQFFVRFPPPNEFRVAGPTFR
jgi:hypothetical protein